MDASDSPFSMFRVLGEYIEINVHFEEDWCRVEDKNIQQNLNILRKAAINLIKLFKSDTQSKKAISKIMLDCLLEPRHILRILDH